MATPFIYRVINIERYNGQEIETVKTLLTRLNSDTVVRSFIREIRVSDGDGTISQDVQGRLGELCRTQRGGASASDTTVTPTENNRIVAARASYGGDSAPTRTTSTPALSATMHRRANVQPPTGPRNQQAHL